MIFRMDQLLFGLSLGLDFVEGEIFGATTNHGKRIAILVIAMAEVLWKSSKSPRSLRRRNLRSSKTMPTLVMSCSRT